jgi:hypothetical protein
MFSGKRPVARPNSTTPSRPRGSYLTANEAESIITDNKELLKLLTSIINSAKRRKT